MRNIRTLIPIFIAIYTHGSLHAQIKNPADIKNFKIVTFEPVGFTSSSCTSVSIDEICTALQKGTEQTLNDKCTPIKVTSLKEGKKSSEYYLKKLSTSLPRGYEGTLCMYVPGYAGFSATMRYRYAGSAAYSAFTYMQSDLIPQDLPCITFADHTNDFAYANFGQTLDQVCFNTVYTTTIAQNPKANIIILASCKGGTTVLNYLTNPTYSKVNISAIKGIVIESPPISLDKAVAHIAYNYLYYLPGHQSILQYLFKKSFPNYEWNQKNILDSATNLSSTIPILIGYTTQDRIANYQDILTLKNQLTDKKNVAFFESKNKTVKHGRLAQASDFQEEVKTFWNKITSPSTT